MSNVTWNSHSGIDGRIFIVVENYLHYPQEADLLPRESILYYSKKIVISSFRITHHNYVNIFLLHHCLKREYWFLGREFLYYDCLSLSASEHFQLYLTVKWKNKIRNIQIILIRERISGWHSDQLIPTANMWVATWPSWDRKH